MIGSNQGAECANPPSEDADDLKSPAEQAPPNHGRWHTTIDDFEREGMGVAGKE